MIFFVFSFWVLTKTYNQNFETGKSLSYGGHYNFPFSDVAAFFRRFSRYSCLLSLLACFCISFCLFLLSSSYCRLPFFFLLNRSRILFSIFSLGLPVLFFSPVLHSFLSPSLLSLTKLFDRRRTPGPPSLLVPPCSIFSLFAGPFPIGPQNF